MSSQAIINIMVVCEDTNNGMGFFGIVSHCLCPHRQSLIILMVVVVCEDTNNGWKFSGGQVSYPLPVSQRAILNNDGSS